MGRLDGRVALITGAARGQGAQAARRFAAEGAQVMLADMLDDQGTAVAAEIGHAAAYAHLDVTDEDAWAKAVAECVARFGKLDALVNNAGIYRVAPLTEITLEDYLAITAVNEVGVFLGMRAVAPALAEAGGGTIVNVSSTAAMLPFPGATAYAASKAAVLGLTKVAAGELGPLGIRVNSVHPGAVDTPMMAGVDTAAAGRLLPLRRIGTTGDIAAMVLFLTCGESAFCTGAAFVADGGLCAGPVFREPPPRESRRRHRGSAGNRAGDRRGAERRRRGVTVFDINADGARSAAERLGPAALPIAGDVASEEDVGRMVAATVERFGRLDILVSNAAAFGPEIEGRTTTRRPRRWPCGTAPWR